MTAPFGPLPLSSLVALVNEWGTEPRLVAGEQSAPYPDIRLFAASSLPPSTVPTSGPAFARAADRLYRVFAERLPARQVALVDRMLLDTGVRPTMRTPGQAAQWTVERKADALLASAAITLMVQLGESGERRLGICLAERCADVYVDLSPGQSKRFCSVTCQTRTRVAQFRQRRR